MNSWRGALAAAAALYAINAYVVRELFHAGFIRTMGSVEGSYIAISRAAMSNWHDMLWWPWWFSGMPWQNVYQPGFPLTVAALARLSHTTPVVSYHALAAFFYCLGPATLLVLCYALTRSTVYSFAAGLFYSSFSPSVILPVVRHDINGVFRPRRFQSEVHYGEGPHVATLALLPLVILALDRAVETRRPVYCLIAPLGIAAILLTNWPGSIGLAFAIGALAFSKIGAWKWRQWAWLGGITALAYGIACRWIPPSTLKTTLAAAQFSNGNFPFLSKHLVFVAGFLAFLSGLTFLFVRTKTHPNARFLIFLVCFTAVVPVVSACTGVALLPQPHRWHLEMELAMVALGGYAASRWMPRASPRTRAAVGGVFLLFCAVQIVRTRIYARDVFTPIDLSARPEYKIAGWFDTHMPNARVFAPGSVAIWMNTFSDMAQVGGCCDQGVSNFENRIALYTIYTGENAGARDAGISVLWLKALGAQAVAVCGPRSKEPFKPFAHPEKFEGVLPVLWRDGDDVIYAVPQRSSSLAHVVPRSAVAARAPLHGLDIEPLAQYAAALDDPALPLAAFKWTSRHTARIVAELTPDQLISVQESCAPGWHATANGAPRRIQADALGYMTIEPNCSGRCVIELAYDGGEELRYSRIVSWTSLGVLAVWLLARICEGV